MNEVSQEFLDVLFPASRTDEFFEALFGDVEDGAYDIRLSLQNQSDDELLLYYELHGREGKCLACNLTSGLPHVLTRHPIIASQKTADEIAKKMNWEKVVFQIGTTKQLNEKLHVIPFTITKA